MEDSSITRYEKISDIVMRLGLNAVLKFNVSLSQNRNDNSRLFSYSEYEYYSAKYNTNLISIKRDSDYYLSIENIIVPESGKKAFIRIDNIGLPKLIIALDVVSAWFTEYQELFLKIKKRCYH